MNVYAVKFMLKFYIFGGVAALMSVIMTAFFACLGSSAVDVCILLSLISLGGSDVGAIWLCGLVPIGYVQDVLGDVTKIVQCAVRFIIIDVIVGAVALAFVYIVSDMKWVASYVLLVSVVSVLKDAIMAGVIKRKLKFRAE